MTSPIANDYKVYNQATDRVFTLNDIEPTTPTYNATVRESSTPQPASRSRKGEMIRTTGNFGNTGGPRSMRSEERRPHEVSLHNKTFDNINTTRAIVDEMEDNMAYSEGPALKRIIGQMNGNPRVKFDLRKKNLHIAEFKNGLRECRDLQGQSSSDKENSMEHNNIENKILGHKHFAEKLQRSIPVANIKVIQEQQLQTEKLANIRYVPEASIKNSSEEPSVTELKKLLKMTEEELFEAKARIIDLEQNGRTGGSPTSTEFERRFEVFKKSVVVNLDHLFGQLRVVKNVLEMNQVHINNVMNKMKEYVAGDLNRKEQITNTFPEEIQDSKRLLEENQGCLGGIARIDAEWIKRPVIEILNRGFEFPNINQASTINEEDIQNMVNKKIEVLLEQGGVRENRYQKISEKINDLEGILRNQEGLTGTAKKIIELEKKLNQTEGEKDQLERQYKGLQRESIEVNKELRKVAEEYETLRRSMVQLTSSQDLDAAAALPKEFLDNNMKEYIQNIENEFLEAKAQILRLTHENQVLATLNRQNDTMIDKLRKITGHSGREKTDMEQEMARLTRELEEYKRLHILSENSHLKIEKQDLEQMILRLNNDLNLYKQGQITSQKENNQQLGKLMEELEETREKLKEALEENEKLLLQQQPTPIKNKAEISSSLEKEKLKQEAIEQLSLMILSKDKNITLSNESKRIIKEIFGDKMSGVINDYEQRIETLKGDEDSFYNILRGELDEHLVTLRSFKKCSEPLFELLAVLDNLKQSELGNTQLGKYGQRLKKRRQELIDAVKAVQENIDRLKKMYRSLINPGSLTDLEVSTQPLYKNAKEGRMVESRAPFEGDISREEETNILKREIDTMSMRMNGLKLENKGLLEQIEKVTHKLEEAQGSRMTTQSSPYGQRQSKALNLKSPRLTANQETLPSSSRRNAMNQRTEESELLNSPSIDRLSEHGLRRDQIESIKGGAVNLRTANMNVDDTRGMMLMQAIIIEDL